MDLKTFVQRIQGYYGMSYPEGQRSDLVEYLRGDSEAWLDALYQATIRSFSTRWKTLPDVATFESDEVQGEAKTQVRARAQALEEDARRLERTMLIEERNARPEDFDAFFRNFARMMREKAGTGK